VRGIEARRRDTPPWVVNVQAKMLACLSRAGSVDDLPGAIQKAFELFQKSLAELRAGKVPVDQLVITSRISHELEDYRSPTPGARAAMQMLAQTGKRVRPGQKMRFIYTRGEPNVRPWEIAQIIDADEIDRVKYIELMARAASSVLHPFGIDDLQLKRWAHTATIELKLELDRKENHVRKIYDHDRSTGIKGAAGIRQFTV
jgi:DNA polymerase-2